MVFLIIVPVIGVALVVGVLGWLIARLLPAKRVPECPCGGSSRAVGRHRTDLGGELL